MSDRNVRDTMHWAQRSGKYGNRKTCLLGQEFDSRLEAQRWLVLKDAERHGKIQGLARQVPYEIIPAQVIQGSRLRASEYVADFVYRKDGQIVVEDTKGYRTEVYRIKRKLMAWRHGVLIREISSAGEPV